MKKNRMMRLASVLLVAVLMTTCTISGTFAKYVTEGTGTDHARVAKWGVGVVVEGETFKKTYPKDDTSFNLAENTVVSNEDVVAPGTKGSLGGVTLAGIPEVACKVTYEADLELTGWEVVGENVYCPIKFTVKQGTSNEQTFQIALGTNPAELEAAVEKYINDTCSKVEYKAGTNLAEQTANNLKVSWEWPFSVNDYADTKLGDQAANGNAATIDFTLKCTVTQID